MDKFVLYTNLPWTPPHPPEFVDISLGVICTLFLPFFRPLELCLPFPLPISMLCFS